MLTFSKKVYLVLDVVPDVAKSIQPRLFQIEISVNFDLTG